MCAEKLGKTLSFRLCYSTALAYSQNARELRDQNTEFFRQAERHLVVTPTKNKRLSMSNIKRLTEENEGQILLVTLRFGWFTTNRKSTMRANKRFNCLRNTQKPPETKHRGNITSFQGGFINLAIRTQRIKLVRFTKYRKRMTHCQVKNQS